MSRMNDVDFKKLKESYQKASEDIQFRRLVKTIKVSDDIAMKYTSSLETTVSELNNCSKCKGLIYCKNRLEGFIQYPENHDNKAFLSSPHAIRPLSLPVPSHPVIFLSL